MAGKRGRPVTVISYDQIAEFVGKGMTDSEICKTLKLARSTYMKWLSEDNRRARLQVVRSESILPILTALYKKSLAGSVGASREMLRRLERWDV